eukprot:jgi/Ulvmu1/2886/UM146_0028.1
MPGSGRVLRVSVLGLRVRDPRRYSVHVAVSGDDSTFSAESLHNGSSARTETCPVSINPDFMNKHLLLRLPCALGALLKPQAMLHCSLWAAPDLNRGVSHVAADGQLSDELIGEGDVHVVGEASSRLLRGDRVTISVSLTSSSKIMPTAAMDALTPLGSGPTKVEVMLELLLVDAHVTLHRDILMASRASDSLNTPNRVIIPGASECDLFVLVSRARGLPEAHPAAAKSGESNPPSAFVAAKSSRDILHGGGVQGATRVAPSSCNPAWDEVLVVRYVEKELEHERLVLAVVDDTSAGLMASCSIPLKHVAAGHYYNIKAPLAVNRTREGDDSDSDEGESAIYVTVCLANAPCSELERWRSRRDKSSGVVQLRLASCSVDTHGREAEGGCMGVFARVKVGDGQAEDDDDSDADSDAEVEPVDLGDIYIELSGKHAADNAALQAATAEWDMGAGEIMPILGQSAGAQLWPVSRMCLLALAAGSRGSGALLLSLHVMDQAEETSVLGQCALPIRNLPEDGDGALVPYSGLAFRGGDDDGAATLEVRFWTSEHYLELVRSLVPAGVDPQQWTAALPGAAAGGEVGLGGVAATVDCLVEDAVVSQAALQRLQRTADTAVQRCELAGWRLRDLDGKNKALHRDVAELRKLLHESRGAEVGAEEAASLLQLPHDQLLGRCQSYVARVRLERTKNAELLRRLKEQHAHDVDAKKVAVHMGELQRAHLQQNRVVRELEDAVARVPVLKKTVRNQQQVIASLEGLLRRTVAQVKDLKAASTEADAELEAAAAAKAQAEASAAQSQAKAEVALALAAQMPRGGKKQREAARAAAVQPAARAPVQPLPVPVPTESPPVHARPLPAPGDRDGASLRPRSPQHTPLEVVALRRELGQARERMRGLEQAAREATGKEQEAVKAAAAAEAESQSARERAQQAEEAAQAADNDLLEATMAYAREMAQMKAKLVEKEAQLLGGFGSPDKLQSGSWPVPPGSPLNLSPQNDKAFLSHRPFGFRGNTPGSSSLKSLRWEERQENEKTVATDRDGLPPIKPKKADLGRQGSGMVPAPSRPAATSEFGGASGTGVASGSLTRASTNSSTRRASPRTQTTASGFVSGVSQGRDSSGSSSTSGGVDSGGGSSDDGNSSGYSSS